MHDALYEALNRAMHTFEASHRLTQLTVAGKRSNPQRPWTFTFSGVDANRPLPFGLSRFFGRPLVAPREVGGKLTDQTLVDMLTKTAGAEAPAVSTITCTINNKVFGPLASLRVEPEISIKYEYFSGRFL